MSIISGEKDPPHLITEPLRSSDPVTLPNGDIRMAIAVAGQSAYTASGQKKILTEKFLSTDYFTWENGAVSTNHENTNPFLGGATLYDLEYDSEKKLVYASFANLPDKARRLINSEFYAGLSQECLPKVYAEDGVSVISGHGTGCTIVMWPHQPAAGPEMGVGVRPALAAILSQKYPTESQPKDLEDSMSDNKTGGGTPAISTEAYESIVSEKVELKSQITTLVSENKKLGEELASWKQKYTELESGEADRTKIAISEARAGWEADLKATSERETAVSELKNVMSEESAKGYLSTNPTLDQIKSITAILKSNFSKGVGTATSEEPGEESYESINRRWEAKAGRA